MTGDRRAAVASTAALVGIVVAGCAHPGGSSHSHRPRTAAVVRPAAVPAFASSPPADTAEGARAVAVADVAASQNWLYLRDGEVDQSVRAMAAPTAAAALVQSELAELRDAREALSRSSGRVWWIVRPLTSRVERFDPGAARVDVWTVTVLSAVDVAAPQADWARVTVDLVWVDGSWRLVDIAEAAGPTPQTGTKDTPWQAGSFDKALDGYQRIGSEVGG